MRLSYDLSLHSVCFCIQHSLNSTGQLKVQHTDTACVFLGCLCSLYTHIASVCVNCGLVIGLSYK